MDFKLQQFLNNFINRNQNPIFKNLIQMAREGNEEGLKNFGRNLYNEKFKGDKTKDFDKDFANFMQQFKR